MSSSLSSSSLSVPVRLSLLSAGEVFIALFSLFVAPKLLGYYSFVDAPARTLEIAGVIAFVLNGRLQVLLIPNGNFARAVVGVIFGTVILHVVAVILGAPFPERFEASVAWSFYVSSLICLPTSYVLRDVSAFQRVFVQFNLESLVDLFLLYSVFATLGGAWLAAFVIPLDWDRPWQRWPIPCTHGACGGFVVAVVAAWIHGLMLYSSRPKGH